MIHFYDLPQNRNRVSFDSNFKEYLINKLVNKKIDYKIIRRLRRNNVNIKTVIEISRVLNLNLDNLEKEIIWIGALNSKGLSKPKLPLNLNNRQGARFIAAIVNDGCLTNNRKDSYGRLMYDNFDKTIRTSIINDYLYIFGGKEEEVSFRDYDKKKFLEFPSVIRDFVFLILKNKGPKSESNLDIPSFIKSSKENILGWIEQTIADEGNVNYNLNKYRREIVWRRSLDVSDLFSKPINKDTPFKKLPKNLRRLLYKKKCKLIEDEKSILNFLGIKYKLHNIGIYKTVKENIRTRWQISITKRENLVKLRKLINIPSLEKDNKFTNICNEFSRYKEPLIIKEKMINLGKDRKIFTSIDLKIAMNYSSVTNTYKWLKKFKEEGLIKKIKESSYGNGYYKKPAKYELI